MTNYRRHSAASVRSCRRRCRRGARAGQSQGSLASRDLAIDEEQIIEFTPVPFYPVHPDTPAGPLNQSKIITPVLRCITAVHSARRCRRSANRFSYCGRRRSDVVIPNYFSPTERVIVRSCLLALRFASLFPALYPVFRYSRRSDS